jgi:hypothetical protein
MTTEVEDMDDKKVIWINLMKQIKSFQKTRIRLNIEDVPIIMDEYDGSIRDWYHDKIDPNEIIDINVDDGIDNFTLDEVLAEEGLTVDEVLEQLNTEE